MPANKTYVLMELQFIINAVNKVSKENIIKKIRKVILIGWSSKAFLGRLYLN